MSSLTLTMIERAEADEARAERNQLSAKRRVLAKREARRQPIRRRTA